MLWEKSDFSKARLRNNGLQNLILKYEFRIFRVHTFFFCKKKINQQLFLAKKNPKKQNHMTFFFLLE